MLTTAPESLFWWWILERHSIYLKKMAREPKPWTEDPIFQQYKFTNPFRENDTGTVWLREHFLEPHRDAPLELIAFNIGWYRMFNWVGTAELLGWQSEWKPEEVVDKLSLELDMGRQVFTGAHIVRSEFGRPKIDAIVDVCTRLWDLFHGTSDILDVSFTEMCLGPRSLEVIYKILIRVPYIGPFLAYEMVTDMRHTRLLENATDIMTWANAGPGAMRGLERLQLPWSPPPLATDSMRFLLSRWTMSLPTWFPPGEMRDIEHSLCEFSKYCKVKFNEGHPRSRYPGV